jgi:hypothetical protein
MFRFQPFNMYHFPFNLFSYITPYNAFSPIESQPRLPSLSTAFGLATSNRRGIHACVAHPWGGAQPHPTLAGGAFEAF